MEGIEEEADDLVPENLLAPREPRPDLPGLAVLADEDDVQMLGVVREVSGGRLRSGNAVARLPLDEPGDRRLRLAGRAVQKVLQRGGRRDARDCDAAILLRLDRYWQQRYRESETDPGAHVRDHYARRPARFNLQ
jgi:hypothetical protein